MSLEDRLRGLLGLSGYEARAYLTLARRGKARPGDVAREAGIPQQRIYDVLRSLEGKGLVYEEGGEYGVVNPRRALGAYAEKLLLEARRRSEEILELAEEAAKLASSSSAEYVSLARGLESSLSQAVAAVKSCRDKPLLTAYKAAEKAGELWPLLERLAEVLPRGTLVLVPEKLRVDEGYVEALEKRGVEVRRSKAVLMDMLLACDTVVLGLPSREHEVISVVVKNREFSEALRRRIEESLIL